MESRYRHQRSRRRPVRRVVAGLACSLLAVTAGVEIAAMGTAAADTSAAAPEQVRARLYVANGDQNGLANVFDGRGNEITHFRTAFGEGGVIAAGNVVGDAAEELVVVNGNGFVFVYDVATGQPVNGPSFKSSYDTTGETIAIGDVNNDGIDELLVANDDNSGVIEVFDVRAKAKMPGFGVPDTTFEDEDNNGFAVGDVDGDGKVEALVANKSGGRIDVLDTDTGNVKNGFGVPDTTFNDSPHSEFAVGDVDRDGKAEVFVANAGGGRIDVLDPDTGTPKAGFGVPDTTFNGSDENQFKVADVDGDRRVEALVANGDGSIDTKGRIDVLDPATHGPKAGFGVAESGFGIPDMFAVSPPADADLDGDAIPDRVELSGVRAADGSMLLDLPGLGASPCRKDVVVQIDYMVDDSGDSDDHNHKPKEEKAADGTVTFPALEDARAVLAAGEQVEGVEDCPYDDVSNDTGINLISIVDEAIPEEPQVPIESRIAELKRDHFRLELDPYVHWNLWLHDITEGGNVVVAGGRSSPATGPTQADRDDQDFVVTTKGGSKSPGNRTGQAKTYLHELGHVIGLRHGGDENVNCKPNYLSIMNYTFAVTGLIDVNNNSFLGFSESKLGPNAGLDEKHLDETAGLAGEHPKRLLTMWSDKNGTTRTGPADGRVDWNGDNDGGADQDVPVNINVGLIDANNNAVDCTPDNDEGKGVTGFNDWAALNEDVNPVPFSQGGGGNDEPTLAEVATLQQLWDQTLIPEQSTLLAPPLAGFTSPVMGMAVDGDNVYTTHHYRSTSTPPTLGQLGKLVVADRKTLAVKASIPLGFGPRAVAVNPVNHRVYAISGSASGDPTRSLLTIVDGTTLAVVGKTEFLTAQATADIAVNPRTNRVYISNTSQNRIHVLDGITGAELAPILVGPGPVGMAVDESRNTLYVAQTKRHPNQPQVAALGAVVDDGVNKPQILPRVDLGDPSLQPVDVAVDPAGGRVYVAGLGSVAGEKPSVTVLDQATGQQIARINAQGPVRSIALNPDDGLVFASGDGGVNVLDAAELKIVRIMESGLSFSAATGTGTSRDLFVGDFVSGKLTRLPYSSGRPV